MVCHAFQVSAGGDGGAAIGNADAERAVLRVRQKLEGVEVRLWENSWWYELDDPFTIYFF